MRRRDKKKAPARAVTLAAPAPSARQAIRRRMRFQGVFVVNGKKGSFSARLTPEFRAPPTSEITKGLQKGDEIVVGSYKKRCARSRLSRA